MTEFEEAQADQLLRHLRGILPPVAFDMALGLFTTPVPPILTPQLTALLAIITSPGPQPAKNQALKEVLIIRYGPEGPVPPP